MVMRVSEDGGDGISNAEAQRKMERHAEKNKNQRRIQRNFDSASCVRGLRCMHYGLVRSATNNRVNSPSLTLK